MTLRLLPWAPEYGTAMQFDADEVGGNGREAETDTTVEGPWRAIEPTAPAPEAVQIVDGVRRAEAYAMDDGQDGQVFHGLFGSLAVGAVRLRNGHPARVLDDSLRVQRRYLQGGGDPVTRHFGTDLALRFDSHLIPDARTSNDLVAALNRLMLDEEAHLAEQLSLDDEVITLVDGPLRLRGAIGPNVVGYIKRIHRMYVGAEQQPLLMTLKVGQRTPLFEIKEGGSDRGLVASRLSWFLRIADLKSHFHPLAGLLRLEVPGALPKHQAIALADQSAKVLPMLASSPVRDPRSPQNLVPVGALERALTHRLGDRRWVRRLITATVGREQAEALA